MTPSSPALKFFLSLGLTGFTLFYLIHLLVRVDPSKAPISLLVLTIAIGLLFLGAALARWHPQAVKSVLEFDSAALNICVIIVGFFGFFGLIAVWIN